MALITRSIEMSFSASRLRRTVTSMSIGSLLVRFLRVREAAELYLYPSWSQVAVTQGALRAVDLQRDALVVSAEHASGQRGRIGGGARLDIRVAFGQFVLGEGDDDQPADRAPPVPGLGERPVDAWRGHLERVRRVAHRVLRVKTRRNLPADLGDVVQADAAVGVNDHAEYPPAPGPGDLHGPQVDVHRVQNGLDHAGHPGGVNGGRSTRTRRA